MIFNSFFALFTKLYKFIQNLRLFSTVFITIYVYFQPFLIINHNFFQFFPFSHMSLPNFYQILDDFFSYFWSIFIQFSPFFRDFRSISCFVYSFLSNFYPIFMILNDFFQYFSRCLPFCFDM